MLNDRLSLLSLKIIQCLLQLLLGIMYFLGHGTRQSMIFKLLWTRSKYFKLSELCMFGIYTWKVCYSNHNFLYGFLMLQVSSVVVKLRKEVPRTFILSNNHIPSKAYWKSAVNQALQIISRSDTELTKVNSVYARLVFKCWPFLVANGILLLTLACSKYIHSICMASSVLLLHYPVSSSYPFLFLFCNYISLFVIINIFLISTLLRVN